jgi:parallel beta-helix repeat protein
MKRILCWVLLALLLTITFTLAFSVRLVHAQAETVYINSDGSVSPSSAPISSVDNITYTFTGNMSYPTYNGIVVERNNIVIDGNGYTILGNEGGYGLNLTNINDTTIENTNFVDFSDGIYLYSCSSDTVNGNNVTANGYGIFLFFTSSALVSGNNVTANDQGITVEDSLSYNLVSGNNVTANGEGIFLIDSTIDNVTGNDVATNRDGILLSGTTYDIVNANNIMGNNLSGIVVELGSYDNTIYNNDFVGNFAQAQVESSSSGANSWNEAYPTGGNYWSDYHGADLYSGPYQNVTGSDGIGDTPYVIDANDIDYYPLMKPFGQSSTFVTCSPNPVFAGFTVNCTAKVYGSSPTGNVTWTTSSSTGYFGQLVCTLSSGSCSTTYTDNNTGYFTITASYSGDSYNLPSNGNTTLTVFVNVTIGTNVTVTPTNKLRLTFANVTVAGIMVANETPTVNAPTLNNTVGQYYSINVTADFSGKVTVSLAFDGSNMTQQQKSSLQMVQYMPILGDVQPPFGIVNMKDVAYVTRHFGTNSTSPNWDPAADINGDGVVNMKDIALVARHFGFTANWINITTYVDTTNNVIYGSTTYLSFIGID